MSRYQELINLCHAIRPRRVLEIGTWNGQRATELCAKGATYVGFDLFEEANDETDQEEKNVKPHHTKEEVSELLTSKGVEHELIQGNTRETLPAYEGEPFDFVFIDGGHSIETIRSDWAEVQRMLDSDGAVVVFDDYYEEMEDTHLWGCNSLVDEMENVAFSQSADPVIPEGKVRIAAIFV
jgi:predicted O-methyltransferase YrrM